jgi:hypothetical protein
VGKDSEKEYEACVIALKTPPCEWEKICGYLKLGDWAVNVKELLP